MLKTEDGSLKQDSANCQQPTVNNRLPAIIENNNKNKNNLWVLIM